VTREKVVQLQPLPQLQPKITVAESARALYTNFSPVRATGIVGNLEL
jgi:hypothetical protein